MSVIAALTGNGNKKLKVVCPITTQDGKTFWRGMGLGFANKDGSINIYLDGLPVNGKLQIREWDDPPWEKRGDGNGAPRLAAQGETPRDRELPF